ncbi:mammalian cell entry protein [Mycolicibacterium moriokaense]|nr:mammalian cell entry protein [Mycolicibacterium moriokaense]
MEDQPTDSGDLTTDAASESATPRGRHRMPSGKRRRAPKAEPEAQDSPDTPKDASAAEESAAEEPTEPPVMDEPAAAESATEESAAEEPAAEAPPTEEPVAAEPVAEPAERGRRWNLLRRRKNQPDAVVSDAVVPDAAVPDAVVPDARAETDDSAPADEDTADDTADEPAATAAETDDEASPGNSADDAVDEADEPAEAELVLVPHRPAGKRLKIAAAAAAALFVAGGAFLGATAQPVIANRALVETKLDIARTAANAITTLWSYTPENMDTLADRSAHFLTGDFAFQYRKFIDSIAATNKQAQVTNTTSVLGTAVESVSQSEASAIVYTNSVATSPVSKNIPSLRYLSYRLEMQRDHSDWRITRMTTITTLDLTPQL